MITDLEAREREAEARAKMVAHKAQAKTVQALRADNIALMERINAEITASRASAASTTNVAVSSRRFSILLQFSRIYSYSGAVASARASGSGSIDGGSGKSDSGATIEVLEGKEAKVFAAMRSFGAKKRRKTTPAGPTAMQDDDDL